jgi:hypothetical protein
MIVLACRRRRRLSSSTLASHNFKNGAYRGVTARMWRPLNVRLGATVVVVVVFRRRRRHPLFSFKSWCYLRVAVQMCRRLNAVSAPDCLRRRRCVVVVYRSRFSS